MAKLMTVCLPALVLAGCATTLAPSTGTGGPLAPSLHSATSFKLLYQFKGGTDGAHPAGPLLYYNGTFYGTTSSGGRTTCGGQGCGTVYTIDKSGNENVLYAFGNGVNDGVYPSGGVTAFNGTLYGVTVDGGLNQRGSVYSITPSGTEKVLHSFAYETGKNSDGELPEGELVVLDNALYGTTQDGGANGYGTIFRITASGKYSIVYNFAGNGDGARPTGLLAWRGVLFGVTPYGGKQADSCFELGCGTVFKVDQSGAKTLLYSFNGGSGDGQYPFGGLTVFHGLLYGTTIRGGSIKDGVGFSLTTSGKESVLHSLCCGEGRFPLGGLTELNGNFYGTAERGGQYNEGSLFKLTPSGGFTVLYSFEAPGGARPTRTLTNVGGTLYGTTRAGGAAKVGTVFSW